VVAFDLKRNRRAFDRRDNQWTKLSGIFLKFCFKGSW